MQEPRSASGIESRDGARLVLGLAGLAVSVGLVVAIYHWSLRPWLYAIALLPFIVASNLSEWIIRRTPSEQDVADSEVLTQDALQYRSGPIWSAIRLSASVVGGVLAVFIFAVAKTAWQGGDIVRALAVAGATLLFLTPAIFLVGLLIYYVNAWRAARVQKRQNAEVRERVEQDKQRTRGRHL